MTTPLEQKIFPDHMLIKGPDAIRGSGYAFIVTRYADPEGNRWFIQPGHVGHETMTNSPGMLQALFGPKAQEVAAEVVMVRDGYDNMGNPTGKKVEYYDYREIRRLARATNLFGRSGVLENRPVVMLWGAPEHWQSMLAIALERLNSPADTVVTVGSTNQFLASDFLGQSDVTKKVQAGQVGMSQAANSAHLDLLSKYHTAQGPDKVMLARQLGLKSFHPRTGPSRWRGQSQANNLPYVYSYGENYHVGNSVPNMDFRAFIQENRDIASDRNEAGDEQ